jgi:hypothetical protein
MAEPLEFEEIRGGLPMYEPVAWHVETVDNDGNANHVCYTESAAQAMQFVPMILAIASQGLSYKPSIRTTPLYSREHVEFLKGVNEKQHAWKLQLDTLIKDLLASLSVIVEQMDYNDEPGYGMPWHENATALIANAKLMGYDT